MALILKQMCPHPMLKEEGGVLREIEVCFGSDNLSLVVPSLPNLFCFKDPANTNTKPNKDVM